jgi:uncharacterized protein with ATP-grasp and redox domains
MPKSQTKLLGDACHDCLLEQSARLATRLIQDPEERAPLLNEIRAMLKKAFVSGEIVGAHRDVYAKIYQVAGNPDPFLEIKQKSTEEALALYPRLKEKVESAEDPLDLATRYAIAGNVIDFALPHQIDLHSEVETALERPLAINHLSTLKRRISESDAMLYIGDNAGETVLDRLLIETMGLPTVYLVRSAPVINDALEADAQEAGLDRVATIRSSGSNHAGTVLEDCSPEVQELFASAPIVISKGQGNFETLIHTTREIFFLLKVKCDLVAGHVNANVGDSILLAANASC